MRLAVVIPFLFICISANAQYNSDWKEVKQRKIRTATAYKFDEWGDSIFYRCTYDISGRLIETSYYGKNDGEFTYTYARSGKAIGFHHVFISGTETGLPNPSGKTIRFDTSSIWSWKLDEVTGEKIFVMQLNFDNDGKRQSGLMMRMCGDTTFHFQFRNNGWLLSEFEIRSKVGTMKRGWATSFYQLHPLDYTDSTQIQDTTVGSSVAVLDKRGNEIHYYSVSAAEEPPKPIRQPDGTLYSPVHDTLCYLTLMYTYKNVYHNDGTLDYSIQTSPWTKESKTYTNSIRKVPIKPIASLKGVMEYGPVTFQYYSD